VIEKPASRAAWSIRSSQRVILVNDICYIKSCFERTERLLEKYYRLSALFFSCCSTTSRHQQHQVLRFVPEPCSNSSHPRSSWHGAWLVYSCSPFNSWLFLFFGIAGVVTSCVQNPRHCRALSPAHSTLKRKEPQKWSTEMVHRLFLEEAFLIYPSTSHGLAHFGNWYSRFLIFRPLKSGFSLNTFTCCGYFSGIR